MQLRKQTVLTDRVVPQMKTTTTIAVFLYLSFIFRAIWYRSTTWENCVPLWDQFIFYLIEECTVGSYWIPNSCQVKEKTTYIDTTFHRHYCIKISYMKQLNIGTEVLYGNIDQTLVNSLQGLLNFDIGRLDGRVIIIEYNTLVHCIHT